jgi:2-polyprenyl-6-methoxyphenol hydroxylase-like FAD-dependent oxidoreductase
MTQTTDVLITGAGPTGLTTAIELARRNVDVRVIERRSQPSTRSKALVIHARTLELMDLLGIADEMVQRGYTSPGIDFSANAQNPLRASMYHLDTRFPFILILPQAETEKILERRLNELGVEVERNCQLTQFSDTQTGVRSIIEGNNRSSFELESRYLVGADGAHSIVRKTLNLPFEGSSYDWTAFLGDVRLHGHHAEGGTEQHSNNRGLAFIVPFKDGSHRIVTIDRQYQNEPKKQDLSLAELQESISAIMEKPVELSDPAWLTRWGSSLRLASQYRVGRVFIGGDASHTHSPAGGQGLNTGVQDAFNLGWKLALVVKGNAPATVLDTYHKERFPIGKKVLRISDFLLRSLLLRQPILRSLREWLFRLFIPLPPVQHHLALNLSGLGIQYQTGEGQEAGKRIPDIQLMTAQHERVRLYELLRFPGYTLILFVNPNQVQRARTIVNHINQSNNDALQVQIVLNNGLPELHDLGVDTLVDYRGDWEMRLGSQTGRTLLLRPDGYVAFDLPELDVSAIATPLQAWKSEDQSAQQLVTV